MLSRDEDILKAAEDWRKAGRGVALATVVETWGSAPRPVGSNLVIDNEGNFLGSVSGGCVEGAVVTEAIDVIDSGKPKMLEFGVADEDGVERRPVLRRHHPRLCREGELLETRHPPRAQCRTRRAPRGRRRHRRGERRAAAGESRRCRARIRCSDAARKAHAHGQKRHGGNARRAASFSPCTCRRRSSSSPAPCISARRWRRSGNCSAMT